MNLRKGISIINTRTFVGDKFGPAAWGKLLLSMADGDRIALSNAVAEGWYDIALHTRMNRAFCDFFYDGNLAGAEELGRFSAERDLVLTRRHILSLVRPSFAARHIGLYWRQDEGSGSWTSHLGDNVLVARLSDWHGGELVLCRRLVGYFERILETAGPARCIEHVHESRNGTSNCTFSFNWEITRDVPVRERIDSKAELAEVARELGLFTDVASLAEAITDLLHAQLGYSYVALWVRPADCEGLTLVRDTGEKGAGSPVCAVLQRGGRIIGRLDVESGPDAREDLFDELVPLLAMPLDATRLSGLQLGPERDFARRLLDARVKWQLTAKEGDVLELLMRGSAYKEIAQDLDCEPSTIEQHATRVLRKSGTKSRSALCWKFWTEV